MHAAGARLAGVLTRIQRLPSSAPSSPLLVLSPMYRHKARYPPPFPPRPMQLGCCQGGRGGGLPGGDPGPVHTQLLPEGVGESVNIVPNELH